MPRFNVTMPQELWDAVGVVAPEGNRSWFIRRALEAALGGGLGMPAAGDPDKGTPVSPRASVNRGKADGAVGGALLAPMFRCPDSRCDFTAPSPKAKCGAHGRTVVPR